MKMNDIEVCVLPGEVLLVQILDDTERAIVLTAEQAKMVGNWIVEAAETAKR